MYEPDPAPMYTDVIGEEIHDLLAERQKTHGDAWLFAGQYLTAFDPLLVKLKTTPYLFAWLMIFVKLLRAASNPFNQDNWKDIEGYARLVRDHLRASK